jgi:P-type Ca2+ transporter type 2C
VARESASLVLLDDDFSSIVATVRPGPRIFDSIKKADRLRSGGACAHRGPVTPPMPLALRLFHFAPLHATDLTLSLVAGLVCVLWFESVKRARRRQAARA